MLQGTLHILVYFLYGTEFHLFYTCQQTFPCTHLFFLISSLPALKKGWYHPFIFHCCSLVMTATYSHKETREPFPLPGTSVAAGQWEGAGHQVAGWWRWAPGPPCSPLHLHHQHRNWSSLVSLEAALLLGRGLTCPSASTQEFVLPLFCTKIMLSV